MSTDTKQNASSISSGSIHARRETTEQLNCKLRHELTRARLAFKLAYRQYIYDRNYYGIDHDYSACRWCDHPPSECNYYCGTLCGKCKDVSDSYFKLRDARCKFNSMKNAYLSLCLITPIPADNYLYDKNIFTVELAQFLA
jgi:hypothetical protein